MRININNQEKIEQAIDKAEGKSWARTINVEDILYAVELAETQLHAMCLPKKYWIDTTIKSEPPTVCNSFIGSAKGTYFQVTRLKTGWFVTKIERVTSFHEAYGATGRTYRLYLSEQAKDNIPVKFNLHSLAA